MERGQKHFDGNIEVHEDDGGYQDFGSMNVECLQCKALHYTPEIVEQSLRENLIFADFWNNKTVYLPLDRGF